MATASAGRADKGSSRGSRAFRAPLQRDRLAVGGQGRGEEKPKARQPSSCAQTQGASMSDPEIEELRDKVHCAVVLERTPPPWKLDRKESTKLSLKYRRGKGEILIVSHGGKGWWDPTSDAKGDVFGLVQRLEPGINFGHVRKRLREFAGLNAKLSDRRKGRAPQSLGQIRRRTLGRSEGRVAGFADLALSRPEAVPSIGDHRGGFRGRRLAGGPSRKRLVRSFQRRGFRRPRRHSWADLQRLAHRRREVPLPLCPRTMRLSLGSFSPRPRSTL